jgi:hypothetical protein
MEVPEFEVQSAGLAMEETLGDDADWVMVMRRIINSVFNLSVDLSFTRRL